MNGRDASGRFAKGHRPTHGIRPGQRLSPDTEFKPGGTPANKEQVGSVHIRHARSNRTDSDRAWIKTGEPNQWMPLAQWIWIGDFGAIPRGCIIHHLNGDPLDDSVTNLALVARAGHVTAHRPALQRARSRTVQPRDVQCPDCDSWYTGKRRGARCSSCAKEKAREASRRHKQRVRTRNRRAGQSHSA